MFFLTVFIYTRYYQMGLANNYHFINSVMQRSGCIYNLGGAVTGCYAKELEMIANYFNVINL